MSATNKKWTGTGRHAKRRKRRYWSHDVMKRSDALDLEEGVFTSNSPRKIAEAISRNKHAAQGHALSIRHVDAQFLHQPSRQDFKREEKDHSRTSQTRTA